MRRFRRGKMNLNIWCQSRTFLVASSGFGSVLPLTTSETDSDDPSKHTPLLQTVQNGTGACMCIYLCVKCSVFKVPWRPSWHRTNLGWSSSKALDLPGSQQTHQDRKWHSSLGPGCHLGKVSWCSGMSPGGRRCTQLWSQKQKQDVCLN